MTRPTLICHMITSIDGRLLAERWHTDEDVLLEVYDGVAERLGADGWIVGRATMQAHYLEAGDPAPTGAATAPRRDLPAQVAPGTTAGICIDRKGVLRPESAEIEGAHLVIALGPDVAQSHAEALAAKGISVFFLGAGPAALGDLMDRIGAAFGLRRLLLEGGGTINAAFLREDLIDEASTLIFPVVDGQGDVPAIYHDSGATEARLLELIRTETVAHGCVWLHHRVRHR